MTIKEYRDSMDMTQQQLANALEISLRTVANWEAGAKRLEDIHPFFTRELLKIKRHHDKQREVIR